MSQRWRVENGHLNFDTRHTFAVSQFRVCILRRSRPLRSLKASPSETLLTASVVVKWDGLAFGALPGCVTRCFTLTSRFLLPRPAKVMIYFMRRRHFLCFFLFRACKESWDMWSASSKNREKKAAFVGCSWRSLRCDIVGLQMRPPKDADPKLRHSNWVPCVVRFTQQRHCG